jgi:hypothetical protein
MRREADQTPTKVPTDRPVPLNYAPRSLRLRHSFFSCASMAMAVLTVAWLYYVQYERPRYHMGGPFWKALWDTSWLPGGIGLVLAAVGLIQNSRTRVLSVVAIVVIVLAYVLLMPPLHFA